VIIVGALVEWTATGVDPVDGGVAIWQDGAFRFAMAEERATRIKYAGGFRSSLSRGLAAINAKIADVDRFCFASYAEPRAIDSGHIVRQAPELLPLQDRITIAPSHHELHALYGFRHSPFNNALIAVLDNEGMVLGPQLDPKPFSNAMERCSYFIGGPNGIDLLTRDLYSRSDVSLGEAFRRFNYYCGFPSHQHSGKTMALAAYGNPERFKGLSLFCQVGGRVRVDLDGSIEPPGRSVEMFFERSGVKVAPSREPEGEMHQDHLDGAAFVQLEVEKFLLTRLASILSETGMRALVLCGGVAYNCRMVGLIERELGVPVFVPPSPGDQGICIGAVQAWLEMIGYRQHVVPTSYLGGEPGTADVLNGHPIPAGIERISLLIDAGMHVAKYLDRGHVVALVEGASEFGRRALGHRSLLAVPDKPLLDRLRRIKQREWFRPFGISLLASMATRCFGNQSPDPYMLRATLLRPGTSEDLETVAHADRTIRAQQIDDSDPGLLAATLRELARLGRAPALVNTSLNRAGEPLVETFAEAFDLFLGVSDIDVLVHADAKVAYVRTACGS